MRLSHITTLLVFLYTAAAIPIHGNMGVHHRRNQLQVRGALERGTASKVERRGWGSAKPPHPDEVQKVLDAVAQRQAAQRKAYEEEKKVKEEAMLHGQPHNQPQVMDSEKEKHWMEVQKVFDTVGQKQAAQRKAYDEKKKAQEEEARLHGQPHKQPQVMDSEKQKHWMEVQKVLDQMTQKYGKQREG